MNALTPLLIDGHCCDCAPWLQAKQLAGRHATAAAEPRELHQYLLGPMGVTVAPGGVDQAVNQYRTVRDHSQNRLHQQAPRAAEEAVMPGLLGSGL